ncbi:MAG: hypothetical protein OJI70_13500 [Zavarzinia sp.]|nr:hypothetical protein [Zavarzinia sp.]
MGIVSQVRAARRPAVTSAVLALGAIGLAACGSSSESASAAADAVPCPAMSVLADAASLTRFAPGAARTPDNVLYEIEVIDAKALCQPAAGGQVTADVGLSIYVRRGPAGRDLKGVSEPFFLTLTETNTRVISRASYQTVIPFDNGKNSGGVVEHLSVTVPLEGKSPYAFEMIGGIQLSADELADERKRRGK